MFGYVVANVDKLDEQAKERYRSVYCGLCHALRRQHGQLGRLTLTYDMTFLILLLSALDKTEISTLKSFRCPMHPLQKREAFTNRHTQYAADMNVMLAYYQRMDDWEDEGKRSALLQAHSLGKHIEQLKERYPRQAQAITDELALLHEMEQAGEPMPDLPAAAFGRLLGAIFTPNGHALSDQLYDFGEKLGRFIYLMDAAVDLKKDIQQEKYNPLVSIPTQRHYDILQLLMADCAQTFETLPIHQDKALMENILYSGVWSRYPVRREGEQSS